MIIFTAKLTRKKTVAGVFAAGLMLAGMISFLPGRTFPVSKGGGLYDGDAAMNAMSPVGGKTVESGEDGARFLQRLGYETAEKPLETAEVIIPKEFDAVYEEYNEMQKKSGYDLSGYKGKRTMLYTFVVRNHPSGEEDVRANLLVQDGRVIGGDICTVRLDGFMHGLIRAGEYEDSADALSEAENEEHSGEDAAP